jgi:hypothetical protein
VLCPLEKKKQVRILQRIFCEKIAESSHSLLFGEFFAMAIEKQEGAKGIEVFLWKKMGPSDHIMRKKILKSPYLENWFQKVTKLKEEP